MRALFIYSWFWAYFIFEHWYILTTKPDLFSQILIIPLQKSSTRRRERRKYTPPHSLLMPLVKPLIHEFYYILILHFSQTPLIFYYNQRIEVETILRKMALNWKEWVVLVRLNNRKPQWKKNCPQEQRKDRGLDCNDWQCWIFILFFLQVRFWKVEMYLLLAHSVYYTRLNALPLNCALFGASSSFSYLELKRTVFCFWRFQYKRQEEKGRKNKR